MPVMVPVYNSQLQID